ncbi:MAG: BlaI/MecI/CopY family transcriptional regulator [Armatimonadetes bacterium]|nr:BlaI/MecI/CopY family transcriptional regulator [Armatimonadota bacterium]
MKDKPPLGAQELEVLRFVADHAPATVRLVTEQFGEARGLARTTIQTMMERLRKKGYLIRTKADEGTYQYSPSLAQTDLLLSLVQNFVEKTLGGSISPFLAYLSESPDLTPEEIEELRRLLELLKPRPERGGRGALNPPPRRLPGFPPDRKP